MARSKKAKTQSAFLEYNPTTWTTFLRAIEDAKKKLKFNPDEECFYRGQGNADWPLLPTLQRIAVSKQLSDEQLNNIEASLFWEFRARATEIHQICRLDWDYLVHMRHHGVPTRILDWTELFGVAVYFALQRDGVPNDQAGAMWLLNPYVLNEGADSWGLRDLIDPRYIVQYFRGQDYGDLLAEDGFSVENPVAIYPLQSNPRMRAQRGWFTIHGKRRTPLEQLSPRSIAKVTLPASAFEDAQAFLSFAGLTDSALFPGLDGLGVELSRKNGLL